MKTMNPDWLLKHFEQISEAPDAVPRLRRFILDLAVRGKLVEQDPADEPAAELLSQIQLEKQQILARGRTQNHVLSPIEEREIPFVIPPNWTWVRLGEVIKLWNGFAFKSSDYKQQGIPVIRIGDLQNGQVVLDSVVFVDDDVAASVDESVWVPENALLIAMSGATTGKVAFNRTGKKLLLNQRVGRVQVFSVHHDLLRFFFETIVQQNLSISFGTAIPNLSTKQIYETAFPLPPLAEQHRIVAKVDELMALCDELVAAQVKRERRRDRLVAATLHGLNNGNDSSEPGVHPTFGESARFYFNQLPHLTTRPEHIHQLRQTILNLAVRGKLVPQDPKDEPASGILNRIKTGNAQLLGAGKIKKDEPPTTIVDREAPFELPPGWLWARFPELGTFERGKSKHRPRNDPSLFEGGTYLFVQTGDVARSNGVIETFTSKYNDVGLAQSAMWAKGTLCITIAANIADSGILGFDACFPDSVVGFIPASIFPNACYFEYFMRTAKADLLKFAPATAQKNINLGILNQVLIPLPPLAEQQRIVAKVGELMALCDELETKLTSTLTARRQLLEATLQEALSRQHSLHREVRII